MEKKLLNEKNLVKEIEKDNLEIIDLRKKLKESSHYLSEAKNNCEIEKKKLECEFAKKEEEIEILNETIANHRNKEKEKTEMKKRAKGCQWPNCKGEKNIKWQKNTHSVLESCPQYIKFLENFELLKRQNEELNQVKQFSSY